jgi:hypothetical protein
VKDTAGRTEGGTIHSSKKRGSDMTGRFLFCVAILWNGHGETKKSCFVDSC